MESIDDRLHLFQDRMCGEVKRKLYSGRKYDPEIRIEIPVEEDVFEVSIAARARRKRNRQVYRICTMAHKGLAAKKKKRCKQKKSLQTKK